MVATMPALSPTRVWWSAVRPATLAASVAPVLVGTAISVHESGPRLGAGLLALLVGIAMQVGVNFANDYSDHVRGADSPRRVGPLRAASSGVVEPADVRRAAIAAFGLAAVGRTGPQPHHGLAAARGRGRLPARRMAVHRRPAALRLPRSGRGFRIRVLRAGRDAWHRLRRDAADHAAGRADGLRDGLLRHRHPRPQQPARPGHRSRRGQVDPCDAHRPSGARARCFWCWCARHSPFPSPSWSSSLRASRSCWCHLAIPIAAVPVRTAFAAPSAPALVRALKRMAIAELAFALLCSVGLLA